MNESITSFVPSFDSDSVTDLRRRLAHTRLPDEETVEDWSQGIPLSYLRELVDRWADDYDMSGVPNTLKSWPNFLTSINEISLHFIHLRSSHSAAQPLLLTHGWPGSVLEFRHVIDRLTEPTAFGGTPEQAFHVVIPSLPGYGFSGKPRTTGVGVEHIAALWTTLMERLGYLQFIAHGGDWGALVTQAPCPSAHECLPRYPHHLTHYRPRPRNHERAITGRTACPGVFRILSNLGFRLFQTTKYAPTDAGLWTRRLPCRTAGMDSGKVCSVDRLRS